MLSEVYLMAGKYAEAEAAAKAVIDCGYFHLMTSRFGAEKDKAEIRSPICSKNITRTVLPVIWKASGLCNSNTTRPEAAEQTKTGQTCLGSQILQRRRLCVGRLFRRTWFGTDRPIQMVDRQQRLLRFKRYS